MKNRYFRLFANVIVTKGAVRSTLNELLKERISFIPNEMADLLENYKGQPMESILEEFEHSDHETVVSYFTWLVENGYGFWCESKGEFDLFPDLEKNWDMPFPFTNIIIDGAGNEEQDHDYDNIFEQVIDLGIPYIQLRFFTYRSIDFLRKLLNKFVHSRVKHVEVLTVYSSEINLEEVYGMIKENCRIARIIFHSAPMSKTDNNALDGLTPIIFTEQRIESSRDCGVISTKNFSCNISMYMEGLEHNSCLNRKISIDANGEIGNCPSMPYKFGNINNTWLRDILKSSELKKFWNINKDTISVCKDCEFRSVCTDCRAYLQNPIDIYSKPLKCGYDPYRGIWEPWAKNKENAYSITYYNF